MYLFPLLPLLASYLHYLNQPSGHGKAADDGYVPNLVQFHSPFVNVNSQINKVTTLFH